MSAVLREKFEADIDGTGELAAFVGDIRDKFVERELDGPHRHDALRTIARSDRIRELVAGRHTEQATVVARELLEGVQNEGES